MSQISAHQMLQLGPSSNPVGAILRRPLRICQEAVPSFPDGYSDFLRQLCLQLLDKDPKNRPSASEVLRLPEIRVIQSQLLEEAGFTQMQGEPVEQLVFHVNLFSNPRKQVFLREESGCFFLCR